MNRALVVTAFAVAVVVVTSRFAACNCSPGLGAGEPCVKAADCAGNLVCDPDTSRCADLTCANHGECGTGAYCDPLGHCVDNSAGGPCLTDNNCVTGESCRSGTCGPIGGPGDGCDSSEDCSAPLLCNPAGNVCAASVPCTTHADCGTGAHCVPGNGCVRSGPESPCESDTQCLSTDHCVGVVCVPDNCQGQAFSAERVPANVMIVLDRSSSMLSEIGNDGSKWSVAKTAVSQMLAAHGADIRFGLTLFPGNTQSPCNGVRCATGYVALDIGDNMATTIDGYLADTATCNLMTPLGETLNTLRSHAGLQDTTRNNYIMAVTDGQANCDTDPVDEVAALFAQTPSVRTFVVGFGSEVDRAQLTGMANAGGTARPQTPNYYQADNAASLTQAFNDIAGAVLGCEYSLVGAASDPSQLIVYFNGVRVPRDPSGSTGWNYDPATGRLAFAGNACVALQHGVVTDLTIVYGCPGLQPGGSDAGVHARDAAGQDATGGCRDRCDHPCGIQACLLPQGVCGPCTSDGDCCPNSICLVDEGTCLPIGG